MTEELTDPALWSVLSDPATQLFLDTLGLQGGIEYLLSETWVRGVMIIVAAAFSAMVAVAIARSKGTGDSKAMLAALVVCCTLIGATKNILTKSSSDDGVTLVSVEANVTNGLSRVTAVASGGDPAPMWYREAASNEWTLATDDGWVATLADHTWNVYTREWQNADTNEATVAHQMWFFGQNPPAVELTATGGVTIVSAMFTGKFARFEWYIDPDISLPYGSEVHLQNMFLDDNLPMWNDAHIDGSPDHLTNITTVTGFFLDKKTAWRLRLEVPR